MRPAAIAFVGLVGLLLIFVFVAYVQVVLLGTSLIVCLPIALGFLLQGHKPKALWLPGFRRVDPASPGTSPDARINIEGRTFPVHELPPRFQFTIRCRNLHALTAIALVAIGAALTCLFGTDSLVKHIDPGSSRYLEFYSLCYLMVVLFFPALAWLSECALLQAPGVTLANIGKRSRGGLGTLWIPYQFTDPQGGYHGGSAIDFGGPKGDQLKVVFCDPRNPEINKLSCGFLFHKVVWTTED